MDNFELQKEFDKVERLIAIKKEQGDVPPELLHKKIDLLKRCYGMLSDAMQAGDIPQIAPLYAQELAFLNNIKDIQLELNETTNDTDSEIARIHESMRNNGLGWILDNQP